MWIDVFEPVDDWKFVEGLFTPFWEEKNYRILDCPLYDLYFHHFYYKFYKPTKEEEDNLFTNHIEKMIAYMESFTKEKDIIPVVCYIGKKLFIKE